MDAEIVPIPTKPRDLCREIYERALKECVAGAAMRIRCADDRARESFVGAFRRYARQQGRRAHCELGVNSSVTLWLDD